MNRRSFLAGSAAASLAGLAGCFGLLETQPAGEPPVLEERPNAVYYPTHVEGMSMLGTGTAGDYEVGLSYSFPHRFWTVTGSDTEKVEVRDADSMHLMASVWDPETKTVLPVGSGVSIEITRDGETVASKPPWPMLSQRMGFHYGDNYALEGDGTYEARVEVGPTSIRKVGSFAEKFGDGGTATVEFEFSTRERDGLMFRTLDDQAGTRGAVDLMSMGMTPVSTAPAPDDLPGEPLGSKRGGDVTFAAAATDADGEGGTYLAVSPRTRYNGVPLPMMEVSATLVRGTESVFDGQLQKGVGPDLGYHYGAVVDGVESGDELSMRVDTPTQTSRHEGYETAFFDVPEVTLSV